jgi:TPP-dependent pyruvate/acetoin dehydrogenase alpha subunit
MELRHTEILRRHGVQFYRAMFLIREFDLRAGQLLESGEITGEIHQSIGQEAVAVGVISAMRPDDLLTSTHRGHAHLLAKGCDPRRMMSELFGKASGYCKGKGGSMHITSLADGILGANAILGAGTPIAVGAAFAERPQGRDRIAATFFGDGAANEGIVHEAMNLAAAWKIPVLFVCENNQYAVSLRHEEGSAVPDLASRAGAYGFPGITADGMDVVTMFESAGNAVAEIRSASRPCLIEAKTYRFLGHFSAERALLQKSYRAAEEVEDWKRRDPLTRLREELAALDPGYADTLDALEAEVRREIEEAVAFARESEFPRDDEAFTDNYATPLGGLPAGTKFDG